MIFDYELPAALLTTGIVLLVLVVLKEIFRKSRKRLIFRIVASLVLILGVVGMLLQPVYLANSPTKKVAVLTKGVDNDVLDSLKNTDGGVAVVQWNGIELDEINEIILLGEGLEEYDFGRLKGIKVNYIPGARLTGISAVYYNSNQTRDKSFKIEGHCKCTTNSKIVISGPEGRIDSLRNSDDFEFVITPKVVGKLLYYIEYWQDTFLIERNPVPVNVQVPESLNALMLNGFPTFESNHIKQFLGMKSHAVVVRNRVSADRFNYEFVNSKQMELRTLTSKVLQQTDLLIIDQNEWGNLSRNERQLLENEITNGLGLLLHGVYDNSFAKGVFAGFDIKENNANKTTSIVYEGQKLTSQDFSFLQPGLLFPVLSSNHRQVSAYRIMGRGKVAVVLAANTYQLNLKGEETVYASFWSKHIEMLMNNKSDSYNVGIKQNMTWHQNPVHIEVITLEDGIPKVDIDNVNIALGQSVLQKEVWSGKFWPQKSGWHEITNEDRQEYFYVFDDDNWKTLRLTQKIKSNKRHFDNNEMVIEQPLIKKRIPLYYAFLLYLLGASYLWLEAKL